MANEEPNPARNSGPNWALVILTVVVILVGLGTILLPNHMNFRHRSSLISCKSNLKNIATALEMFASDHEDRLPESLAELTSSSPPYLDVIPECREATFPFLTPSQFEYSYEVTENGYLLSCQGDHSRYPHVPKGYPLYTEAEGLKDTKDF